VPYSLLVYPSLDPEEARRRGPRFSVQFRIGAAFPEPARTLWAYLEPLQGGWKGGSPSGVIISPEERRELSIFRRYADSIGLVLDPKGFSFHDWRVSIDLKRKAIRFKGGDFESALAILGEGLSDAWRELGRNTSNERAQLRFGCWCASIPIRILSHTIESDTAKDRSYSVCGLAILDQGKGLRPIFFENVGHIVAYNPSETATIIIDRDPTSQSLSRQWDLLTFNYEEGWFEWEKPSRKPY